MVLSSFLALYLCLESPCNMLGQSHSKLIIFWAKVTPSLGSQTPQILNFITLVGSEHLNFPKLHYFKVQNNYIKMSSALFSIRPISMFKITF